MIKKQKPAYLRCVNPPIYQASTFIFDKVEDLSGPDHKYAGQELKQIGL